MTLLYCYACGNQYTTYIHTYIQLLRLHRADTNIHTYVHTQIHYEAELSLINLNASQSEVGVN